MALPLPQKLPFIPASVTYADNSTWPDSVNWQLIWTAPGQPFGGSRGAFAAMPTLCGLSCVGATLVLFLGWCVALT
jgi:hypothetical protein